MKKYILLLALLLSGCSTAAQALNITNGTTPRPVTATAEPTRTPIPTATIGYQETAVVAQQTADEARRVNAVVTAEFEQRIQEQMIVTAQYEQRVQEVYAWTATAALTSVPLTATQQAAVNTQAAAKSTSDAARLTATYQAPTAFVAMERAKNSIKYEKVDYFVRWILMSAMMFFLLWLVSWFVRNPVLPKAETAPEVTEFTVHYTKRENGGYQQKRLVLPCTPEQLTELAASVMQDKKTLAINQWEGKDTLWTRNDILRFRAWVRDMEWVIVMPDDQLAPKEELRDFLLDWLDSHRLPDNYCFEAEEQGSAEVVSV